MAYHKMDRSFRTDCPSSGCNQKSFNNVVEDESDL